MFQENKSHGFFLNKELEELYKKRGKLKMQKARKKLEYFEHVIAEKYSEKIYQTTKQELKRINSED